MGRGQWEWGSRSWVGRALALARFVPVFHIAFHSLVSIEVAFRSFASVACI